MASQQLTSLGLNNPLSPTSRRNRNYNPSIEVRNTRIDLLQEELSKESTFNLHTIHINCNAINNCLQKHHRDINYEALHPFVDQQGAYLLMSLTTTYKFTS